MVHQDVSEENICKQNGVWKLILTSSISGVESSQSKGPLLTRAPELYKNQRLHIDDVYKRDIWSLGLVIYRLLFKKNPDLLTSLIQTLKQRTKTVQPPQKIETIISTLYAEKTNLIEYLDGKVSNTVLRDVLRSMCDTYPHYRISASALATKIGKVVPSPRGKRDEPYMPNINQENPNSYFRSGNTFPESPTRQSGKEINVTQVDFEESLILVQTAENERANEHKFFFYLRYVDALDLVCSEFKKIFISSATDTKHILEFILRIQQFFILSYLKNVFYGVILDSLEFSSVKISPKSRQLKKETKLKLDEVAKRISQMIRDSLIIREFRRLNTLYEAITQMINSLSFEKLIRLRPELQNFTESKFNDIRRRIMTEDIKVTTVGGRNDMLEYLLKEVDNKFRSYRQRKYTGYGVLYENFDYAKPVSYTHLTLPTIYSV
eukprot:TRINITY_DN11874_c0_g1_i8.p1 TRINITY_DN11874_c0_g1~~TRINITY_DN11874_c0_g1_i8.p1  ORF type:complete len:436 (-),score=31.63 TRINITY_DN11874_c0_g1_i8:36-1343(-)